MLDDVARIQFDDGVHRAVLGPPALFVEDHLALCLDHDEKTLAVLCVLVQDVAGAVGCVQPARTAWSGAQSAATAANGHAHQRAFPVNAARAERTPFPSIESALKPSGPDAGDQSRNASIMLSWHGLSGR